jgi:hypothetical protein
VRCHGGQAQGGAQADAVESHLINTVFHRGNRAVGVSPGVFTLSASCITSVFCQLSLASRSAVVGQWQFSSKLS